MEIISFLVKWKAKLIYQGWCVKKNPDEKSVVPDQHEAFVPAKSFKRSLLNKVNLRSPLYTDKFSTSLLKAGFDKQLEEFKPDAHADHMKVFYLALGDYWKVPWEMVMRSWKDSLIRKTALLRIVDYEKLQSRVIIFAGPLKILILEGHPGPAPNNIDIKAETISILAAIDDLPGEVKKTIDKPVVHPLDKNTLPDILRTEKPNLIWFNGHGKSDPAALLDAKMDWVSAQDFGKCILDSPTKPFYIILSSCDTASHDETNKMTCFSPMFFESVKEVPITLMAMQSPIQTKTGRFLAREILLSFRSGLSLELAFSAVRAQLKKECLSIANNSWIKTDWASPVLWTNSHVTKTVQWHQPLSVPETLQLAALNKMLTIPENTTTASVYYDDNNPRLSNRIQAWFPYQRLWLTAENSKADTNQVYQMVQQLIAKENLAPLVMDFSPMDLLCMAAEGAEFKEFIKDWAKSYSSKISIAPNTTNSLLNFFASVNSSSSAVRVWEDLCQMQGLFLIMIHPPRMNGIGMGWLLKSLNAANNVNRVWCIGKHPPQPLINGWGIDNLQLENMEDLIEQAVHSEPRLIKALAMLDAEIRPDIIRRAGLHSNNNYDKQQYWQAVFLQTANGPLIKALPKQTVLAQIKEEEKASVHTDCTTLLKDQLLADLGELSLQQLERLFYHAVQAQQSSVLNSIGNDLIDYYFSRNLPYQIIRVANELGYSAIPATEKLKIAWAYMQLFKPEEASAFLEGISETGSLSIFEKVRLYAMKAEIFKNIGAGDIGTGVDSQLDRAINLLNNYTPVSAAEDTMKQKNILKLQHDKIRVLQYLHYDLELAAEKYKTLLKEWKPLEDSNELNRAVIFRNLAECVRKLAAKELIHLTPDLPTITKYLTESESFIDNAINEADKKFGGSAFGIEAMYEKAKLYGCKRSVAVVHLNESEVLSFKNTEHQLLQKAATLAYDQRFDMLWAIIESRIIRLYTGFDEARIQNTVRILEEFTHGWAVRSLLILLEFEAEHYVSSHTSDPCAQNKDGLLRVLERQLAIYEKYGFIGYGESDKENIIMTFCRLVTAITPENSGTLIPKLKRLVSSRSWLTERLGSPQYRNCQDIFLNLNE